MLAYELYLKNKDYEGEYVNRKPIKKIFVNNESIQIDQNTIEEYGGKPIEQSKTFQRVFQMPSSTSNSINLPNKKTGSNSPEPYLKLYGSYQTRKDIPIMTISIGKKNGPVYYAEMDLDNYEQKFSSNGSIRPRLDRKNYAIDDRNLSDSYVEADIIDNNGVFSEKLFKKIAGSFFHYVKTQHSSMRDMDLGKKRISFELYILPFDGNIQYKNMQAKNNSQKKKSKSKLQQQHEITDCFGNNTGQYASTPTQTAKFLSYDDPAFTLNCRQGSGFYQSFPIGTVSHSKVNLPPESVFDIAGLRWVFTSLEDQSLQFNETRKGLFTQLVENYETIRKQAGDRYGKQVQMKMICYRSKQAKLEILIDENLTMDMLSRIVGRAGNYDYDKKDVIPFNALEVLIDKENKNVIWSDYLYAVRTLVTGGFIEKKYLIEVFNRRIRKNIFDWIDKKHRDAQEFFRKAAFCIKVLSQHERESTVSMDNERFAYKIGLIAGEYVKFKKNVNEESNSLNEILTYTKYDREKLRHVLQRVGLGINLSKAQENKVQHMNDFITENLPKHEITDDEKSRDFSYFFYKGAFARMGKSTGKSGSTPEEQEEIKQQV